MLKLLRNYIREQKNSILQLLGLGLLIVIMASSFLSINFATNYVKKQFYDEIAQKQFHQEISFGRDQFFVPKRENVLESSFFSNMDYQIGEKKADSKHSAEYFWDFEKLKKATFQIKSNGNYSYTFIFYSDTLGGPKIGENLFHDTNKKEINFKLNVESNFDGKESETLDHQAALLNKYVINNDHPANQYMIISPEALAKFEAIVPDAKKYNYNLDTIKDFAKIYQLLIKNMLFNKDNQFILKTSSIKDFIITGKAITFLQTSINDPVNKPIIIKNNTASLLKEPLKNKEILIPPIFAKANNLKVGQKYNFYGLDLTIKGIATSSMTTTMLTYFGTYDNKNVTTAFASKETMDYIAKAPNVQTLKITIGLKPELSSEIKSPNGKENNYWIYQYLHNRLTNNINKNNTISKRIQLPSIKNGIDTVCLFHQFNMLGSQERILEWSGYAGINNLTTTMGNVSFAFISLIFIVTTIIIFIIIFKMIERNKKLLGVLKASGYSNWKLNLTLVSSVLLPLIFFSTFGAGLSVLIGHLIIKGFENMLNLIAYGWYFDIWTTLLTISIPIIGLLIVGFLITMFLLRTKPLYLIYDQQSNNKKSIFKKKKIEIKIQKNQIFKHVNYKNKLVITTAIRSLPKTIFIIVISFFSSILLLFSFISMGLVNNMLNLNFDGYNFNYNTEYVYNQKVVKNFVAMSQQLNNEQLIYKKMEVDKLKSDPNNNFTEELITKIKKIINKEFDDTKIDFRYRYTTGNDIKNISQIIEKNRIYLQEKYKKFLEIWDKNQTYINYFSTQNLITTFGLIPYQKNKENPYISLETNDIKFFDINKIDVEKNPYNANTNEFIGDVWQSKRDYQTKIISVNDKTTQYISPDFINSNENSFSNLSWDKMKTSTNWLDEDFVAIANKLKEKLKISDDNNNVVFMPIIPSYYAKYKIGDTIKYTVQAIHNKGKNYESKKSLDNKDKKYIIGIVYDISAKASTQVFAPENWLQITLFDKKNNPMNQQLANQKFSNLKNGELQNYFTIINEKNNYIVDLLELMNDPDTYLATQEFKPQVSNFIDLKLQKEMLKTSQYTFNFVISIFTAFSIFLSFMIIVIISNINIRDHLKLINTLLNLGYNNMEVSYLFLVVTIPLIITFSALSLYFAPILAGVVANALSNFIHQTFPIILKWWYYALSLLIVLIIYLFSYFVTWKINIKNKKMLM